MENDNVALRKIQSQFHKRNYDNLSVSEKMIADVLLQHNHLKFRNTNPNDHFLISTDDRESLLLQNLNLLIQQELNDQQTKLYANILNIIDDLNDKNINSIELIDNSPKERIIQFLTRLTL